MEAGAAERMAEGGEWRAFQQEIAALHMQASTEEEYVALLEAHDLLVRTGEDCLDGKTYAKILPIAESEYLMFLNKEAIEGDLINPVLLARVVDREVAAGRLDPDSRFAQLAKAGGAVLGDSAEITAHRCKRGDFLFYGMAGAAVLAWALVRVNVSPLWLILVGLIVGGFLNVRENQRIKAEIAERRASPR